MLKEDLRQDVEARVAFLKKALAQAGAKGFVYGNSGGKDCTLVGILCKLACENTFGVCMPCSSSQNYGRDLRDGMLVAKAFGIETVTVDLSQTKDALMAAVTAAHPVAENAAVNVAPRLRMATLYARRAGGGHGQPQRAVPWLFYQVGRRRLRREPHCRFNRARGV